MVASLIKAGVHVTGNDSMVRQEVRAQEGDRFAMSC